MTRAHVLDRLIGAQMPALRGAADLQAFEAGSLIEGSSFR
jgi:hypothetical protein